MKKNIVTPETRLKTPNPLRLVKTSSSFLPNPFTMTEADRSKTLPLGLFAKERSLLRDAVETLNEAYPPTANRVPPDRNIPARRRKH